MAFLLIHFAHVPAFNSNDNVDDDDDVEKKTTEK